MGWKAAKSSHEHHLRTQSKFLIYIYFTDDHHTNQPHYMSVAFPMMAVATANRQIAIFDLDKLRQGMFQPITVCFMSYSF